MTTPSDEREYSGGKIYTTHYDRKLTHAKGAVDAGNSINIRTVQERLWKLMEYPEVKDYICSKIPASHQHYLNDKESFVDGKFGKATELSVKAAQEFLNLERAALGQKPLTVDGVWGNNTRDALAQYNARQDKIFMEKGEGVSPAPTNNISATYAEFQAIFEKNRFQSDLSHTMVQAPKPTEVSTSYPAIAASPIHQESTMTRALANLPSLDMIREHTAGKAAEVNTAPQISMLYTPKEPQTGFTIGKF